MDFDLENIEEVLQEEPVEGQPGDSVLVYGLAYYSELLKLLEGRSGFCLPLGYIHVTSNYGFRQDPVYKGSRFHNGIDLRCRYEKVYSMLAGRVKKVAEGHTGYGNYVVLDHGGIECLYGHLSKVLVSEGETFSAGKVIAISGNSGKSTGPHLHIQLLREGKSINPLPFVKSITASIDRYNRRLAALGDSIGGKTLNEANLMAVMRDLGIHHRSVVLAQSLLETGYYTSRVCREYKNLFGLRRPSDGSYYRFDRWEDSVRAYRDYVQYKYKGGDYYVFLSRIGYAEDKDYIHKVRTIEEGLGRVF